MRIVKDAAERKKEILDTAEQLFLTQGYHQTTINDILNTIGIAKGTFYYYFRSKEEVMDAIILRLVNLETAYAQKIVADSTLTAVEKLCSVFTGNSQHQETKEAFVQHLHQVENSEFHLKSLIEIIHQLTPILTQIVQQGIEEQTFHTDYPQETIEFLLTAGQFIFDFSIFQWTSEEYTKRIQAFIYNMERMLHTVPGTLSQLQQALLN